MKTVLAALNSKYAHSSLALRYLEKYNSSFAPVVMEFTINDPLHTIYRQLLRAEADVYGFSCYIWNVEQTLKVASMLKIAKPNCRIVLGGPECSYRAEQMLQSHTFIDHILSGEGEVLLGELLSTLQQGNVPPPVLTQTEHVDLNTIPLPYTAEDLKQLQGKIIYFETSRGCPFCCSYCLSAADRTVRYFPMEYVKKGLDLLFANGVPLVKLIDRTFNANSARAEAIIEYIMAHSSGTCVHLEIEPSLLTDRLADLLCSAPNGMFQLEMGIQSTHEKTLEAVGRTSQFDVAAQRIRQLKQAGNMHLHLDLIAGLPHEDVRSFERSFNDVYALRPSMLQMGFLKLLHGAPMRQDSSIMAAPFPPYEVLSTRWIDANTMCFLKEVEAAVDLFYNSGAFPRTMELLAQHHSPFHLYAALAPLTRQKTKRADMYQKLYHFICVEKTAINGKTPSCSDEEIALTLTYDFLQHQKGYAVPSFANKWKPPCFKQTCHALLQSDSFLTTLGISSDPSLLRFEAVLGTVLLVDHQAGTIHDVGQAFKSDEPLPKQAAKRRK